MGHRSCTVLVMIICCFSGSFSAWFALYQDNSHCVSLTYCTHGVASVHIHLSGTVKVSIQLCD